MPESEENQASAAHERKESKCPKCERLMTGDECDMCHYSRKIPQVKQKYVEAFICKLLAKTGGYETLSLEQLDKFPAGEGAKLFWNPEDNTFTIANPAVELPSKIIHNKNIITLN